MQQGILIILDNILYEPRVFLSNINIDSISHLTAMKHSKIIHAMSKHKHLFLFEHSSIHYFQFFLICSRFYILFAYECKLLMCMPASFLLRNRVVNVTLTWKDELLTTFRRGVVVYCQTHIEVFSQHKYFEPPKSFTVWASCQIRKIAGCAYAGNAGNVFPPLRVSDPDMHHGTCVTHVPWCMPGSLTSGFLWSRWREKHFRRIRRNPQFYVSGKRPISSVNTVKWW